MNETNQERNSLNQDRKIDHLKLVCEKGMQSSRNWMDDVFLHPKAIPTGKEYDEVDTGCKIFGRRFDAPFYVAAMTGGHPDTTRINEILAKTCARFNIPMGIGSQRVALEDETLVRTYRVARDVSDDLFLIGNIGIGQLARSEEPVAMARKLVEMIDANALAVHFNKLQELVQPEGDRVFKRSLEIIDSIAYALDVPVIVKEVGMGFTKNDCVALSTSRAAAIDVGGFGGTNFAMIEAERVVMGADYPYTRNIGEVFKDVGTPTPASVYLATKYTDLPVIATGGIRTGIDVVKAIALGANMAGVAYPFLVSCLKDLDRKDDDFPTITREMNTLLHEIKVAMVLLNAGSIEEISEDDVHVSLELKQWIE